MSDPSLTADGLPWSHILRLGDMSGRREVPFALAPDSETRAALARYLRIEAIRKLRFEGNLRPFGKNDWTLEAKLGATVVQSCVVTLEPVSTRIDAPVVRRYLADWQEPEASGEIEMPEDDSAEGLPAALDLGQVMAEALVLAMPDFPRATGAALGEAVFTERGKDAMRDEDARPFAGLADLRAALNDKKDK